MKIISSQPILILGGFLISSKTYSAMSSWLKIKTNFPVKVVEASRFDWLSTNWTYGWKNLLDRVDKEVEALRLLSPTGKVTLIGHSSGGVMLRLYLADAKFAGRIYSGLEKCDSLITLGSPNNATRATPLRAMVSRKYPGAFFSNSVNYISVAGNLDLQSENASFISRRFAKSSYKSILNSQDKLIGDGLVPIESSLLEGSTQIILSDTAHSGLFGKSWYGSINRLNQWFL